MNPGITRNILQSILKLSYDNPNNGYLSDEAVKSFYELLRPLGKEKSIYFFDIDLMTSLLGKKLNDYVYSRLWKNLKEELLISNFDHWVIPMERNSHFMTIHIDFKLMSITYYDPLYDLDESIVDILINFLRDLQSDGLSINVKQLKTIEASFPKQRNLIDCGMISLMIAECILAEDSIVQNFKQDDIDFHRKVLAEYLVYIIGTEKKEIERDRFPVFCRIKETFLTKAIPQRKEKVNKNESGNHDVETVQDICSLEESFKKDLALFENIFEEQNESPTKTHKIEEDLELFQSSFEDQT